MKEGRGETIDNSTRHSACPPGSNCLFGETQDLKNEAVSMALRNQKKSIDRVQKKAEMLSDWNIRKDIVRDKEPEIIREKSAG